MGLNSTSQSERLCIIVLGACNSGKSSLVNMLAGEKVSLTSEIRGTTTDPVRKSMEIPSAGPCLIVDTAGFDDPTPLGKERIALTLKALDSADIAILLTGENPREETLWETRLRERKIPVVKVCNKSGLSGSDPAPDTIRTDALTGEGKRELIEAIISAIPPGFAPRDLLGNLVKEGDTVLLVMPQDSEAPKGRLILPQSQTIRAILDKGAFPICTVPEKMADALDALRKDPDLIITDSQAFASVEKQTPPGVRLTSFSILMAAYKGDIATFVEGAAAIGKLHAGSRVLIAEACAHAPASEDIGRVKIPAMLRKKAGDGITVDIVAGRDFPDDLSPYDLVIHCGACMFNRRMVMSRVEKARAAGVAMTNYGVAIACLKGILGKVVY